MRRMDRYNDEDTREVSRRSNKNQELYETIGTNTRYTDFTDVTNANAYDISKKENVKTREGYHKMRESNYFNSYAPKERRELADYNKLMNNNEHKVYDINSVLENARKNKDSIDELEEKRKLKNTSYNILSSKNKKELEEYRRERQERIKKDQEAGIKTIIDKTLAGEINKEETVDLLGNLMATNIMDAIEKPEREITEVSIELDAVDKLMLEKDKNNLKDNTNDDISKELLNKEQIEEVKKIKEKNKQKKDNLMDGADKDFYTRSMDLSDQDFLSDELKDNKIPLWLKLIIFILMIGIAVVAGYFIHQNM